MDTKTYVANHLLIQTLQDWHLSLLNREQTYTLPATVSDEDEGPWRLFNAIANAEEEIPGIADVVLGRELVRGTDEQRMNTYDLGASTREG